jgi:GTP-binding protein HflX
MDALLTAIADRLHAGAAIKELVVPFERGDVLAKVHRLGEVLSEEPSEGGIVLTARLDDEAQARLREFLTDPPPVDDEDDG